MKVPYLISAVLTVAVPVISAATGSNCKDIKLTVSGSASNRNLTGINLNLGLDGLLSFYQNSSLITISGKQTIAGTYCSPTVQNANNGKLQVLYGSITEDRSGWQALGDPEFPQYMPEKYSWTKYANAKGYATLALDRLGNGLSSHPDPILVVQAPYEMALYNDVAKQIRAGTTGALPMSYDYIVYVGNSLGSQIGTGIANEFPKAYDELLLTAFSKNFQQNFAGISLATLLPAQAVDPARFGKLPVGYVTTSSQVGRTNSFFGSHADVDFTDEVAQLFFDRKDVVSAGQLISIYAIKYEAPKYTGRVLVLDGQQDQAVCGPGSPVLGPANCTFWAAATQELFPSANYNWKTVDRTGHAIQLHKTSQTVYSIAHRFLGGETFQGGPPA